MTDSKLYQVEDGWIETYTGIQFHFARPTPDEISIVDVAHALSLLCRYNGHTGQFYSVAEHSVLICDWLRNRGHSRLTCLTGLLHDVAEAYIGDMPRPIKVTMPDFKAMESRIEEAAAEKFGFLYPFPPIVKECDTRILVDERLWCMNDSDNEWGTDGLEGLGVQPKMWDPKTAEDNFMGRYAALMKG